MFETLLPDLVLIGHSLTILLKWALGLSLSFFLTSICIYLSFNTARYVTRYQSKVFVRLDSIEIAAILSFFGALIQMMLTFALFRLSKSMKEDRPKHGAELPEAGILLPKLVVMVMLEDLVGLGVVCGVVVAKKGVEIFRTYGKGDGKKWVLHAV